MKKNTTKTPKTKPAKPANMEDYFKAKYLHKSFFFLRDGHDWHSCDVSVLAIILPNACRVARCSDVADAFLQKTKMPKGWRATFKELL